MGRTRRNCPVFGCTSTHLARLANHLDQIHHMNQEERKKWLHRSKLGLCMTLENREKNEHVSETCIQKSLEKILQRQNEIENKFYTYLKEQDLQKSTKNSIKSRRKPPLINGNKDGSTKRWMIY